MLGLFLWENGMAQESRLAIVIDSRSAEQRANDLKTVLDHLEQSGAKATVTLRGTGDSAKSVGDKSKGAAQSIGEMATAIGSVVSVGKLWAQIEKATFAAGRYDQLGIIMEVVGRNAGHSAGELAQLQSELEATGISMEQSRQVITRLIQANIDLSQATRLARLAQDAATIGNISSSEALERLVVGVQTSQVEILRNIGIVTNFETAYKKFAEQAGRTTASLSEQEKMQARVNAVMEQGPAIAGAYEASMENANKQMGSMARHADNLQVKLGEAYQPAFALAIEVMTDGLKLAGDNAGALSVGLAGVTAAAATATTGILALRAGALALNVALNAMRAHPVIMALSVLTGVVAAVGVAFSGLKTDTDVGGSGLDDFGKKVDALRTKVNDLREAEAKWAINEITKMHKEAEGEVSKLGARVEWLQVQLSRHPSSKMVKEWNEQLTTAQKEFLGASDQAETYRQRLDDLQGQIAALKGEASSGSAAAGALETVDEFLKDVQKRMIAMDTGSSAVARANQLIFENASLTEEQRTAVLKAAQAEDILRESLKSRGSASSDMGKQYLTEIRERLALIGKEAEYEKLLAQVAVGALTFRTAKQLELAKAEAQRLDAAEREIEIAQGRKANVDTVSQLTEQLYLAGLAGEELAMAQARLSLNDYATPEQIAHIEALGQAMWHVKQVMSEREMFGIGEDADKYILGDFDPLKGGLFDNQLARYEAEAEAERERYQEQLERLRAARELQIETSRSYDELEEQAARDHATRMEQIDAAKTVTALSSAESMFGGLADIMRTAQGEQSAIYKAMFLAEKAAGFAQAIVNAEVGASKALGMGPFGIPLATYIRASGYMSAATIAAQTIQGMAHDGIDAVPKTGTWLLEKGERVMTSQTSARLDSVLERINAGMGRQNSGSVGPAAQPANITVVVNNAPPGTTATVRQISDEEFVVDVMLKDAVRDGRFTKYGQRNLGWGRRGT